MFANLISLGAAVPVKFSSGAKPDQTFFAFFLFLPNYAYFTPKKIMNKINIFFIH